MKPGYAEEVAGRIIEQLEQGTAPWIKPWEPGELRLPYNPTTGKEYKGMNSLWLSMQGQSDPRWMTYNQASNEGAQVRKGSKGTQIVYWKFSEDRKVTDEQGRPVMDPETGKQKTESVQLERPRSFMAVVFNASQIDGLPPLEARATRPEPERHARAETILANSGADIRHVAGDRAYYSPVTDQITLPERNQFPTSDRYYGTALHELGHWTGHQSRMDRDLSNPFGSEGYAREELRAEIASLMLGERLEIGHDPGPHVAYVGSWIKALKEDPKEIFRAASDAERIAGYVMGFEQEQAQALTVERQTAPEVAPEVMAALQEQHANAVEGYSPLESWQMMKAEAERHGYTAKIDFLSDPAEAGRYGPDYQITYSDRQGQPTGIRTEMGTDSKLMTERNGKRLSRYISNDDESQPATLATAIAQHEKAINSPRWTIEQRDTSKWPIESKVIGETDSAAEALAIFKSTHNTTVIDNTTGDEEGRTSSVLDGSAPVWTPSPMLVAMASMEEQGIRFPKPAPGMSAADQSVAENLALANNHPEPGSEQQQRLALSARAAVEEAFGPKLEGIHGGRLPEQWNGNARAMPVAVEGSYQAGDERHIPVAEGQHSQWLIEAQDKAGEWQWFSTDFDRDGTKAQSVAQRLNTIGQVAGLTLGQEAIEAAAAPEQGAQVPDSWRGPACRVFDEEMALRMGDPSYNKAQELASTLAYYEVMKFEPSEQEKALLAEKQPELDEAAKWVKENVLLNPVVKERMFETVRDLGRETGQPDDDKQRREYLAEMSGQAIEQGTALPGAPGASRSAEAWVLAHVQDSTMARAMNGASPAQIETAREILEDMQPLNTQNPFWQRHALPDDVDALESKIDVADRFLESSQINQRHIAAGEHDAAAVHREESGLNELRQALGHQEPQAQAYTVQNRRTVPEDAERHAGQQAAYVQLDDGRRAWGFGATDDAAEQSAVKQAQRVGQEADRQPSRPLVQEQPEKPMPERTYLAVPYTEKNEAKALGAKWDKEAKAWYAPEGVDVATSGLARWSGDNAAAGKAAEPKPPLDQFYDALRDAGLVVKQGDVPTSGAQVGKIQRVPVEGDKGGATSGAYAYHPEGRTPGGYIQNYKTGEVVHWKPDGKTPELTAQERAKLANEAQERKQQRDTSTAAKYEATATAAQALWNASPAATAENAYCKAKGITDPVGLRTVPETATPELEALGIKIAKTAQEAKKLREADPANRVFKSGDLLIPGTDGEGKLWTLQSVNPYFKSLMKGGRKAGLFTVAGTDDPAKALASNEASPLVLAEGYATADTVSRLMGGKPVIVAFDSGNLDAVARDLRERAPSRPLLIAADNDHNAPNQKDATGRPKTNVGLTKAQEAAKAHGGGVMAPQFNDGDKGSDWNDLASAQGDEAARRMLGEQMALAKRDAAITAENLTSLARTRDMEARNDPTTSADDAAVATERGHAAEVMAGAQAALGEVRSMSADNLVGSTKGAARAAASKAAGVAHKVAAMHDQASEERQEVMNHGHHGALDGATAGVSWNRLPEQAKQAMIEDVKNGKDVALPKDAPAKLKQQAGIEPTPAQRTRSRGMDAGL